MQPEPILLTIRGVSHLESWVCCKPKALFLGYLCWFIGIKWGLIMSHPLWDHIECSRCGKRCFSGSQKHLCADRNCGTKTPAPDYKEIFFRWDGFLSLRASLSNSHEWKCSSSGCHCSASPWRITKITKQKIRLSIQSLCVRPHMTLNC